MPVPIWAGRYIGLPFTEHGRDRNGIDCWGLVRLTLLEQFSISLPSLANEYRRTADATRIAGLMEREIPLWQGIDAGDERCGDVIVLRLSGHPMHVGLVLGDGQMLHVEQGIDSAIEKYRGQRWQDRVYGFYRHIPQG
ncbi:MAG: NlpC/P60 family protein [bacterium]|nr:NlpC/P60 family protein [bacterium]